MVGRAKMASDFRVGMSFHHRQQEMHWELAFPSLEEYSYLTV